MVVNIPLIVSTLHFIMILLNLVMTPSVEDNSLFFFW